MTSIFHNSDGTRRAILWIDDRFLIEIRRFAAPTYSGRLVIHVYPITDGEVWDNPYEIFTVDESDVIELETEMKE